MPQPQPVNPAASNHEPARESHVARLLACCGLAACQAWVGAGLPAAVGVFATGSTAGAAVLQPEADDKSKDPDAAGGKSGSRIDEQTKSELERRKNDPAARGGERTNAAKERAAGAAGAQPGGTKGAGDTRPDLRRVDPTKAAQQAKSAAAGQQQPGKPGSTPPGQPGKQPGGVAPGAPGAAPGQAAAAGALQGQPGDPAFPVGEGPIGLQDEYFTFSAYSAPVDLTVLVDFVRDEFDLQVIYMDNGLVGQTVVFNTPITIHRDDVLRFLNTLLAQRDYVMVQDALGYYTVQPKGTVPPGGNPRDPLSATRIIPTPGIRPSSLSAIIQGLLQVGRASPSAGAGGGSAVTYLDDLGVIIIHDSPAITTMVQEMIGRLVEERQSLGMRRIEVHNIAASSARDRILELLSGGSSTPRLSAPIAAQGQQNANQQVAPTSLSSSLSNIPERLTVDLSSNSLIFRGREDEADYVRELLELVDVESSLITKWYPVGSSTADAVAAEGRRLQLGDSVMFTADQGAASGGIASRGQPAGLPGAAADLAGSGFVIYPDSGGFVYRGTAQQHARVDMLVAQLRDLSASEEIVYEFYKLKHGTAEEIAATLQDLISSTSSAGRSPLLGRNLGSNQPRQSSSNTRDRERARNNDQPAQPGAAAGGAEGAVSDLSGEDVFVIADEPNNQVVVKAPLKLQSQIRRLIDKLDLRRPQVYIEAQIISITDSQNFRLAVEAQGIIGQWAYNTNFGLSSFGTGGSFDGPKDVATDLAGLTTALIKSKYVPFVVNALQNNTDARIIATPQLLVDDNVEAEVRAEDQQPTLTTSQGTSTTQQSFGGFESAGPALTVTAQISEGGYMKLNYEIILSAFQGDPISPGVPPARQENTIRAESVTVPSDSTIVVGGLTFESNQDIVVKVPLLGDIPLLGTLFRDTRKNDRRTTFYVFITPKIMRDPTFADLRLMTLGPLKDTDLPSDWPQPEAERMELARPPVLEPVMFDAPTQGPANDPRLAPDATTPPPSQPAPSVIELGADAPAGAMADVPPPEALPSPAVDVIDIPPAAEPKPATTEPAAEPKADQQTPRATPVRRTKPASTGS